MKVAVKYSSISLITNPIMKKCIKTSHSQQNNKPVLFLKRMSYYIAIKDNCDARSNLGLIGVGSKTADTGVLDTKQGLCDLINQQGGNFPVEPGFVPSLNGRTSYGNGSGYRGWKNFGSQDAALRYLEQYFNLIECDNKIEPAFETSKLVEINKKKVLANLRKNQSALAAQNHVQVLAEIGFKDAAHWTIVDDRKIQVSVDDDKEWQNCKEAKNALYAFYVGAEVLYVGKTARTLENRFLGYRDPGKTQATNRKCHDEIRKQLKAKETVRIMVFPDTMHLHWGDFRISLAAGLEDSLIEYLKPRLNGASNKKKTTQFLTESEVNEESVFSL